MDRLAQSKINVIRRHYIKGILKGARIARELHIQKDTVYKYFQAFREIERLYPSKLKDFTFLIPKPKPLKLPFYAQMIAVLPELVDQYAATGTLEILTLWKMYRARYPRGYGLYFFSIHFNNWKKEQNLCKYYHRRVREIPEVDQSKLNHWRNSENIFLWRKAVVILDSASGRPLREISRQIEVTEETILKWITRYKTRGIDALEHKDFTPDPKKTASTTAKRENILKLLQQTPKIHGINRTSWKLTDLSAVYQQVYGAPLGSHTIGNHLRKMGYQFQKSRERLVSPDKYFREKMDRIKGILSNLRPDEKFFSVDEYGPAVVNMKTGWSITQTNETKIVPQYKKRSRGFYIMTAALELSTNQVTHFYSVKKNSAEMIRLISILCQQYAGNRTLYITWDCASWHHSILLKDYLAEINAAEYRLKNSSPKVVLAPLPSSAQYLNVIESVFSGMAKSVIHNSDYKDLAECQVAIDRYFMERNTHFRDHPQKAGNKIWGKEIVAPVFRETNSCKRKLKLR
jgi:transposase